MSDSFASPSAVDLNRALTALNAAVEREDYAEAARLKALIDSTTVSASPWPAEMLPPWLLGRLESLGFRYPTPVQSAAFGCTRDAIIAAPTGSGKTMAFLLPLLCKAAIELEARGQVATHSVQTSKLSPTDAMAVLAPAIISTDSISSVSLSPELPPRGAPLIWMIVPREALAEQLGGIAYTLLGGYARASGTWLPGAADSLFKYQGPKGGRVCILRDGATPSALQRASCALTASPRARGSL